jgi:hypothetical protein
MPQPTVAPYAPYGRDLEVGILAKNFGESMENLGSGLTLGGGVLNVEIYGVCEAHNTLFSWM